MKLLLVCLSTLVFAGSAFSYDRPSIDISGVKHYLADEVAGKVYPNTARGYCVRAGLSGDNSANSAYDSAGSYSPIAVMDGAGTVLQTFASSAGAWVITSISCQ